MKVHSRLILSGTCLIASLFSATGSATSVSAHSDQGSDLLHAADQFAGKTNQDDWGDQGDGTYVNPVMPGDFSDLDVIRVGRSFYAISSTLQFSPGVVILQSLDLVNWRIIGHVVNDLTTLDRELNWDRMNRPGRGVWAGAIRYHHGFFWVYFGTPDQGIFMTTAATPAGPWSPVHLVLNSPGWDDPCPFWDDDGQGYLVVTHFAPEGSPGTTYNIHLFKMNTGGDALQIDSDLIIHRSEGSEANKLFKFHGLYYHYYSEVTGEGRVPMMERASRLDGPWETHQLMHINGAIDREPNQGGLIELPSRRWYFVTHQGRGDWEGRSGVLLPVTWTRGWPIIGRVGADGIGNMVWRARSPIHSSSKTNLAASDSFGESVLKPEWEWAYQPRSGMWSLAEKPGALRMHAFPPLTPGNFHTIANVLTQRSFRTPRNDVIVKLGLSGMVDGQEAGIAHFATTWCSLAIVQKGTTRLLQYDQNGVYVNGPQIIRKSIYLRSEWGPDGISQFSYSLDGRNYQPIGDSYQLTWGSYRGDRIGLFTVNSKAVNGYVDFDSFEYRIQHNAAAY